MSKLSPLLWLLPLAALLTACPRDTQEDEPMEEEDMSSSTEDMALEDMSSPNTATPAALSITSISPASGPLTGGTQVLINGKGFTGELTLKFGDLDADFERRSPTQLAATSPARSTPGKVDILIEKGSERARSLAAFEYTPQAQPTTFFCQLQAQSPVSAIVGAPTATLYALVYAQGSTPGAGAGAGVEGELGWGARGAMAQDFTFSAMDYNLDKDGLTPGDLSNDEYGAALTFGDSGDYDYVARFRRDGGDWIYCDLDGSENGIQVAQHGHISVGAPITPMITYCQLQAQSPAAATTGVASSPLHAVVFADGLTQGAGQGSLIEGELGYGAQDAQPESFAFTSMAYNTDKDGVGAGDLSNDEYAAALTIPAAGTYAYVARFRTSQPQSDWFYCDLDGHDDIDPFEAEQLGSITVTDAVIPGLTYCETSTPARTTLAGMMSQEIEGEVYMAAETDQVGAAPGIDAQIIWGLAAAAPSTWTNSSPATYKGDADGAVAGDNSNDRFGGTITASSVGEYGYYFRFTRDGMAIDCDTDGSGVSDFEPAKVGALSVQATNLPDMCTLQFPVIAHNAGAVTTGQLVTIYGRVEEAGVTDAAGADASVAAELWIGPLDADPVSEPARFTSYTGQYNSSPTNLPATQDEYFVDFVPTTAGQYKYFWRFSVDMGVTWSSCDLNGGAFEPERAGAVHVADAATPHDPVNYCRVWQDQTTHSQADPGGGPIFTVEIYEDGETTQAGESANLMVEVGYGAPAFNPALPGAFTWAPMPYKGAAPGAANNDEYEVALWPPGPALPVGSYDVAVRTRKSAQDAWVYCDSDNTNMSYLVERATRLEVVP